MLPVILGVGLLCFLVGMFWEKLSWVAACRKNKVMACEGKLYKVYEVQAEAKKPEED